MYFSVVRALESPSDTALKDSALPVAEDARASMVTLLNQLDLPLKELDLKASLATRLKFHALLSGSSNVTWAQFHALSAELSGRLIDEMSNTLFLSLTVGEANLYENVQPFGPNVAEAFPSATLDIEEAAKCLVLGRGTACVFHLMRVMEVGLKAFGAQLGIDIQHKPGWEGILKKAHGQMSLPNDKKPADWLKNETFLADAIAMLTAVKTAWRNPTMHVEKTYTEERAEDIWNAVRLFMKSLARELHE